MSIFEIFQLGGGIALFLYGMGTMSDGLERVAGDRLRDWLSILTSKRIFAVLIGMGATMLIQSSGAVIVMAVGFVNASMMTLSQAIGIIMGSSIGTTMTGILVSLKLDQIAPLFVLAGVIVHSFIKNKKIQKFGGVCLGFGLLFMGLSIMTTALKPLGTSEIFRNIIVSMQNPLLGLLVGAALTAVIQSSSAFSGILIAMAFEGLITLEAAMPMIIGSNIGTCMTALLASIGTSHNAKLTAVMHLVYKIIGACVFMILMQILPLAKWLQNTTSLVQWQVAGFNTIYNVVNCVLLYPFADQIVKLTERIVPKKAVEEEEEMGLEYIDKIAFDAPQLLVPQLMLEVERMKTMATKNFKLSVEAFIQQNVDKSEKLFRREKVINFLNHEITNVLVQASGMDLSDKDRRIVSEMYHIIGDLERIGDHSKNIMEYAEIAVEKKLHISEQACRELDNMGERVLAVIEICWEAYSTRDLSRSKEAEEMEDGVDQLTDELKDGHIARLNSGECDPKSSAMYTDMVTDLERVSDHAIDILHTLEDSLAGEHDLAIAHK